MASRPTVTVRSASGEAGSSLPLPAVLTAPIRLDVVQQVHKSMAKNKRQPYAVSEKAGHQTSAESWGTGRAVARIPRVGGSGTHRSGQAAFGNMCRGGRMFAPTKVWRRWHVKINQNQRRFAVASALAATALPSLVLARGHRVEEVHEIPLVIGSSIESAKKTRQVAEALAAVGALSDVKKSAASKKLRAGKGKMRGRRHRARRGPLIVYNEDAGIVRAARNLPGVEVCQVTRLNLLQLAPGGHVGRFVVWTEGAFARLEEVWGTGEGPSQLKKDYYLPSSKLANPDVTRLINSAEVQAVVRPAKNSGVQKRPWTQHKNPLKNKLVLFRLNPYAKTVRRQELLKQERKKRLAAAGKKTGDTKKPSAPVAGEAFISTLLAP
ncbi:60S ribosomal protein L4/L1/L2 [Schizopora paradoxa]|uniref:60S ribosomal protein L4/L1/L2 n=1 Tax=Schizopora paradoxa TaxID=27342 RepID=A0A0H2R1G0_9AGAM|nr:60S ribosomal protein L4/L1/L2 [Schizopora paradoxa]